MSILLESGVFLGLHRLGYNVQNRTTLRSDIGFGASSEGIAYGCPVASHDAGLVPGGTSQKERGVIRVCLPTSTHALEVSWWWLSFSDETKPNAGRALGVVVVQGDCAEAAVIESHRLKINPGGAILGYCLPATMLTAAENRNRLLSPDDARELAAAMSRNMVS